MDLMALQALEAERRAEEDPSWWQGDVRAGDVTRGMLRRCTVCGEALRRGDPPLRHGHCGGGGVARCDLCGGPRRGTCTGGLCSRCARIGRWRGIEEAPPLSFIECRAIRVPKRCPCPECSAARAKGRRGD